MPCRPIRVLFVCLGNICRSPMAEAVFAHKVALAGLANNIEADSAGTGSWHVGEPPHTGTRKALADNQIDYAHAARQIMHADLATFDYIVTMDAQNTKDIEQLGGSKAKIVPILSYSRKPKTLNVPDPWYTGDFEETYTLIDDATDGLLDEIREAHGL